MELPLFIQDWKLPDIGLIEHGGVAVRGGHHCARPLHDRLGIQSSTRASVYLYTAPWEIEALADGLVYVRDFFEGRR